MNTQNLTPSFTVGEVVKHSYEMAQKNWRRFIPAFLFSIGIYGLLMVVSFIFNADHFPALNALLQLVSFVVGTYISIVMIRFGLAVVDGDSSTLNEWMKVDGKMLLNLCVASLLYALAVAAGTLLFIIPGVVIALMWYFISFAIVDKKAGIFDAFKMSQAWTAGNRIKMLLVWLTYLVVAVGVFLVPVIFFLAILGGKFMGDGTPHFGISDGIIGLVLLIVMVVAGLFLMLMQYIGCAYMYRRSLATRTYTA